jgi:hypothetical protein
MTVDETSPQLVTPGRKTLSDPDKVEAIDDSLDFQFEPVKDLLGSAVVEKIDDAPQAYSYAPANEPN